jgi:hypothetical protein
LPSLGTPRFFPVVAIIGNGVKLAIVESGDNEFVAGDNGRGEAWRDGDFPLHIFVRAKVCGRILSISDARSVRAAELWPDERFVDGTRSNGPEPCYKNQREELFHDYLIG